MKAFEGRYSLYQRRNGTAGKNYYRSPQCVFPVGWTTHIRKNWYGNPSPLAFGAEQMIANYLEELIIHLYRRYFENPGQFKTRRQPEAH